jgi:hypothetical protein
LLREVHEEFWIEDLDVSLAETDDGLAGTIEFADGFTASVWVEDPLPELEELSSNTIEPYGASQLVMLRDHVSTWRVTFDDGRVQGRANARRAAMLMSTFVESGAPGVFIPALVRLHSPGTVKRLAMDIDRLENLTTLITAAWHAADWMITRGLTAYGLPEVETPIDSGFNAAYFRLMDIAAGMLGQNAPFPSGAQIEMGPKLYELSDGPHGPTDEQVPISGHYGTQSLLPN